MLSLLNRFFSLFIAMLVVSLIVMITVSYNEKPLPAPSTEEATPIEPQQSLPTETEAEKAPIIIQKKTEDGRVYSSLYEPPEPPKPLTRLPAFQINGLSSADLTDEVMIVNFFAAWCPKCARENSLLLDLSENHNIPVYGIHLDYRAEEFEKFFKEHKDPFKKMGIDDFNLLFAGLPHIAIPTTMVVTKDLKIHWQYKGEINQIIIDEEILPLINTLQN